MRNWLIVVGVAVLLVVGPWIYQTVAEDRGESRCSDPEVVNQAAPAPDPTVTPVDSTLSPADADEDNIDIVFKPTRSSRNELTYRLPLKAEPAISSTDVEASVLGELRHATTGNTFPQSGDQIVVVPEVQARGRRLVVHTCFDGDLPKEVAPGRYVGKIEVTGERVEPYSFPVTLTLRTNKWGLGIFFIGIGALLGLVFKTFTDVDKLLKPTPAAGEMATAGTKRVRKMKWEDISTYLNHPAVWFSVGLGLILALVSFLVSYLSTVDFGSDMLDLPKLIGVGLSGQTAGMIAADALVAVFKGSSG